MKHAITFCLVLFTLLFAASCSLATKSATTADQPHHSKMHETHPQQGVAASGDDSGHANEHSTQDAPENSSAGTSSQTPEDWPQPVKNMLFGFLRFEQLEYRLQDGADTFQWEAQGWYGGDYNKLWVKSEGEQEVQGPDTGGESELQALYSRLFSPFWDFQAGLRYDQLWGPGSDRSRFFGVVGVQGLAPYRYEVEPALFVSDDGDVSARLTATKDILFTQRLILQPRFETEVAVQEVNKFGVGQGFNYVDLGLRLRYEIKRELAPYVGINWIRLLGETSDLARRDGDDVDTFAVVFGLRLWF